MSTDLKPCPFCGAGQTLIQPSRIWTGKSLETVSVAVEHWCKPSGMFMCHLVFKGKTEVEAIDKWNRRTK